MSKAVQLVLAGDFAPAVKTPRSYPEARLQRTVLNALRKLATPGVFAIHIPNEGQRPAKTGAYLKRLGMLPGAADLLVIIPSQPPHFLELKAKGRKPSPSQIAFARLCERAGAPHAVTDNLDDALAILRSWGAIRPIPARDRAP